MERYIIICLFISFINLRAQAQGDSFYSLNKKEFKIAYTSNISTLLYNSGLSLGAEIAWKEKKKIRENSKGQKLITNQLLFNGSVGYSTNFTSQTENGLHTYYGLIWRRTNAKRWQFNLELSPLGYYRSFLPETFEVSDGEVSKVQSPGRNYYAPSIAFGIGKFGKGNRYAGWYLNLNYTARTPYNAGALPTFSLQYGHRFNFKKK